MVVDIHTHVALHKLYSKDFIRMVVPGLVNLTDAEISLIAKRFLNDDGCIYLKQQMEQSNIDKAVLLVVDHGIDSCAEYSIEEIHEYHYRILKNEPKRFEVFAGIDPRRGANGIALLKNSIIKYGFKGLKLYPPTGFKITDGHLPGYFKLCEDYNIPVMIHIEDQSAISKEQNYYSDIYTTVKKFKKVKFILAHSGFLLNNKFIKNVISLPNVYLDISGFQQYLNNKSELQFNNLADCHQKILFGSDWPLFHSMRKLSDDIMSIKSIFAEIIDEEKIIGILHNNSLSLL